MPEFKKIEPRSFYFFRAIKQLSAQPDSKLWLNKLQATKVGLWFLKGETRYQAKFLTSRHVRMHKVIFYISNTLRKLVIMA